MKSKRIDVPVTTDFSVRYICVVRVRFSSHTWYARVRMPADMTKRRFRSVEKEWWHCRRSVGRWASRDKSPTTMKLAVGFKWNFSRFGQASPNNLCKKHSTLGFCAFNSLFTRICSLCPPLRLAFVSCKTHKFRRCFVSFLSGRWVNVCSVCWMHYSMKHKLSAIAIAMAYNRT